MKYEHERILIKTEIIDFAQFQSKTLSEFIDYLTNLHKPYIIEVSIFEPIISIDYYEGVYTQLLSRFMNMNLTKIIKSEKTGI